MENCMNENESVTKPHDTSRHEPWNDPKLSTLSGPARIETGPGALKMKASMTLHTKLAVNLYRGRRADPSRGINAVIGLLGFAQKATIVWSGAASDDPIADMYLLKIETAFDAANALVTKSISVVRELISDMEGFDIDVSASLAPVKVDMEFLTPWAWQSATLVSRFDELVRMCLTARHLGLLTQSEWHTTIKKVGNAIRHLFVAPDNYIYTGLRRFRMGGRIKRARSMYAKRGMKLPEIPPEVLNLSKRARFAPPIKPRLDAEKKHRLKEFQRQQAAKAQGSENDANAEVTVEASLTEFAAEVVDEVLNAMSVQNSSQSLTSELLANASQVADARVQSSVPPKVRGSMQSPTQAAVQAPVQSAAQNPQQEAGLTHWVFNVSQVKTPAHDEAKK